MSKEDEKVMSMVKKNERNRWMEVTKWQSLENKTKLNNKIIIKTLLTGWQVQEKVI